LDTPVPGGNTPRFQLSVNLLGAFARAHDLTKRGVARQMCKRGNIPLFEQDLSIQMIPGPFPISFPRPNGFESPLLEYSDALRV
jgi:hypothetical protein